MKKENYIDKFNNLKCSSDILNVLRPFSSGEAKEISETMAIIKKIKQIVFGNQNKTFNVLDLCAGNPLLSLTAIHLLPISVAIAFDISKLKRDYSKVRNFNYIEGNIFDDSIYDLISENTIIVGIHPCRHLSIRIIEIFNKSEARNLILMPCCLYKEPYKKMSNFIFLEDSMGNYKTWCFYLSTLCEGKTYVNEDKKCLSPKNVVINSQKIIKKGNYEVK